MKYAVAVLIVILVAAGMYIQADKGVITSDELAKQGK